MNIIGDIKNKNILLLQGPMGTFFRRLDNYLTLQGANTYKIAFNLGDYFYHNKKNLFSYKDKIEKWEDFIENFYKKYKIDKIILFGDCRKYHKIAIKKAKELNIEIFVFEEGYVRPNFVTFEKNGVNGFSSLPKNKNFYKKIKLNNIKIKEKKIKPNFYKISLQIIIYYILAYYGKILYPNYQHHRSLNIYREFFYGIRNLYRKAKYKITEFFLLNKILQTSYFFVPLQTYNDFQIKCHSKYNNIEEFIEEVLLSFAKYANKNDYIVFKHHPMDRGRKNYKNFIYKLAKKLGIDKKRIFVINDLHLPTLLDNTKGTITINSTVGLQALYHNSPVKVMGNAIYDIEDLTDQKKLKNFWKNPKKPNKNLFVKFRKYVILKTQINGHFYSFFSFENL